MDFGSDGEGLSLAGRYFLDEIKECKNCAFVPSSSSNTMDIFAIIVLIFVLVSSISASSNAAVVTENFNVVDYGAAGDGTTDDSQAFLKAWKATCNTATGIPTVIIPERKTFLVNPTVFSGSCKARRIDFLLLGSIVAPTSPSTWKGLDPSQWLAFSGVSGLNITGSGRIDGRGDDCVSIGDYTSDIKIDHVNCGPGHDIPDRSTLLVIYSIGSLGRGGNSVQVEKIYVNNVNFTRTTNGARIKTWQVGTGFVRGVTFENLKFTEVENPIIIDQNYCSVRGACKELKIVCLSKQTGVHISNVTYNELFGTSNTDVAINLNCSRSVACTGIKLQSIQLTSVKSGQKITSNCNNAHGIASGVIKPNSCLSK
ncbi:hypothetical protein HHK36_006067 [Tetracentron sinense]|uniref:Polygalacturonase n=1 Tax=Tetracentron sinense TaxID=13715 RepID=A0A834ZHE4_TETSI|nr:hypothetical protein HHK36_006067 [Tetracentron sinense]